METNEGFTVTLSAPSAGTTITTAAAAGTILNDDASTETLVKAVNVGGGQFTASSGIIYQADPGPTTGAAASQTFSTTADIVSTTDDPLYNTERWTAGGSYTYEIPVINGTYRVELNFAEIYSGITSAGQRVFDMALENQALAGLQNIDIFGQVGPNAPLVINQLVTVNDGSLSILVGPGSSSPGNVENAKLNGFAVFQIDGTLPAPSPPTVSSVVASGAGITNGSGTLNAGKVVTLTVAFSEAVTVNTSGGTPTQALNNGGVATYTGGSGSNSLTFSYTVAAGQNTSDLTVTAFNLNGATVRDGAGNDANLAGAVTNPAGTLIIDTVAPGVPIVSQVTDDVLPVTGVVTNSGSTDDTTPTVRIGLSGTNAAAGDQLQLFNGTSALGSATVLTSGNISNGFADVTTAALSQGTYNFNAKITDIASNTSGASSNYTVTINSGTAQDVGAWGAVFGWPIIGIHCIMTPDGKILTYGTDQNGVVSGLHVLDVWDPATNSHTTINSTTHSDVFCSVGLIVPETGQVLITGGDARTEGAFNVGIPDANFYNPNTLTVLPSSTGDMQFSRWYGSAVQLATGQILLLGGRDDNRDMTHNSAYAEVYTPGYGFHTLTGAYINEFSVGDAALYPRSWLTSNGTVWTSDSSSIYSIDPTGVGSVQRIGQAPTAISWTMPSIMFAPDKVLLVGLDGSAWIMDMGGATPVFQQTNSPMGGRIWSNLVVLPDGRVMISGGSAVNNDLVGVNNTAEIWDPSTGHWTSEADAAIPRLYHSTTILLADGSVLSLGGTSPPTWTSLNGEIYRPGYLLDATGAPAVRPVIRDAPAEVLPGVEFTMHVDDPASIKTLALMPFGAVTHSFNMSASRLELPFTLNADGSLTVDLPANSNLLDSRLLDAVRDQHQWHAIDRVDCSS